MKITCVVDNSALEGSGLLHEHGLSFWVELDHGSLLFDTGKSEEIFIHNLQKLGIDLGGISTLALSHSHHDHTGGLGVVIEKNHQPDLYANPDFFTGRYAFRNNEYQSLGMKLTKEQILNGVKVHLSAKPFEIFPRLWTTGVIEFRQYPLGSHKDHVVQRGMEWVSDPYLDDMSLVYETGAGLIVICGCCHAGILNTLEHVRRIFKQPIKTIIGGIHLVSAEKQTIETVINVFRKEYPGASLYLNHCTGEEAFKMLQNAFPENVAPFPAGSVLEF